MRVFWLIALVLVVSVWAGAQTLPFRTQGDFYVADQGTPVEGVFRFQDLNGDGDVQDAGEQILFYDIAGPGPDLTNIQAITIHPFDGSVWISGTSLDLILRLEDKNGDGDANDVGEYTIFYDGKTGPITTSSALALAFDDKGVLFALDSGSKDSVIRLVDLNNDGDAMDAGEATYYFDNTGATGTWLQSPADMIFFQGHLYIVDNTITPKNIVRIKDLNNDNDALDVGEATKWADPTAAGGSFIWNIIFELKGPALFGTCITTGNVYRWQDLNNDGDALDANEARVFYDSANNYHNINLKTAFTCTADPIGSIYVCSHTADTVYKLTDVNQDLDANDQGEVAVYVSNTGPPALPKAMDRARDCVIGPAGVITPGSASPQIGQTADWMLDDVFGGSKFYLAALSFGNAGIPLPGQDIRTIPITFDALAYASAANLLPILTDFQGVFHPTGFARAKLAIPNVPALVNLRLHMAFLTFNPASPSGIITVSQPFSFVIGR